MATEKKRFTVNIDHEVYALIEGLAESDNRSVANYVETLLSDHVRGISRVPPSVVVDALKKRFKTLATERRSGTASG